MLKASSSTGVPIEISKDIELKGLKNNSGEDIKLLQGQSVSMQTIKIIPQMNYNEMEIYSVFTFDMDYARREVSIFLLRDEDKLCEQYPYNFYLKVTKDGQLKFKLNCHAARSIDDKMRYNKMLNFWHNAGIRRLNIHNIVQDKVFTVVPDKIDIEADNDDFETLIKSIFTLIGEETDDLSICIDNDLVEELQSNKENISNVSFCESFLERFKERVPKEQTNISIVLEDEDGKVLFCSKERPLPYFINIDFIKDVKLCSRQYRDFIQKVINREEGFCIEKFIFDENMYEYFKSAVEIFDINGRPAEEILNKVFKSVGERPSGKFLLNINSKRKSHWNYQQDIMIIFKLAETEINEHLELNSLLREEKYIEAIPYMEKKESNNMENLAFAYYLNEDYDKAEEVCKKAILSNRKSVAHFTLGLVYLAKRKYDDAYVAYSNGMYLIKSTLWYPVIRENIYLGVSSGKIEEGKEVKSILNSIEICSRRNPKKTIKKCFCNSGKGFYQCHGKEFV